MENNNDVISPEFLLLIITATVVGTIVRSLSIKQDYRQYPNYPNGTLIHLVTGAIASALGAFIIPTLMTKNFTAVTFLTLALQQFREVRKVERESLMDLEKNEFTKRGNTYIDGISKTFESRNYISLLVSFATALTMQLLNVYEILTDYTFITIIVSAAVGFIVYFLLKNFTKGRKVKDIATVREGKIEIKGSELHVEGIFVTNLIGLKIGQRLFEEEGLAAIIEPNEIHYRITLEHFGQRQAMLFESTRVLGLKRYNYTFQNLRDGRIVIAFIPIIKDFDLFKECLLNAPLIESVKKSPRLMGGTVKAGGQQ